MATYSTLSNGSSGDEVKKLQKDLLDLGYDVGSSGADGIYGSNTERAVRAFQQKNGLISDGIVGEKTRGAITGFKTPPPTASVMSAGSSGQPKTLSGADAELQTTPGTTAPAEGGTGNTGYVESDAVKQAEALLKQQLSQRPGEYQSAWQSQLDELMAKILNREKFSYDLNGDALYQQYKDKYIQQGKMAMMDTMGQAQAMTGGYGSSYAQSVGQQAYQGHLQNLNDIVPELYQMALDKYNQDGQDMYNQFGIMADRENQAYGRHRDSVSDWQAELARLHQMYQDERSYDYGKYADMRDFEYGQGRDKVSDEQWQKEFDEAKRQYDQQYELTVEKKNGGSSGTNSSSGGGGGYRYDTHGYSKDQIKALQRAAGITADGVWGPQTQKAYDAGYRPDSKPEPAPEPVLSDAGKDFMKNLPYAHAGSDTNAWKRVVDQRLQAAYNSGRLSESDVILILKQLGIE